MSTARQALERVLEAVRAYLPPDGIDAKEALSRIIAEVDPWPLVSPSTFAALPLQTTCKRCGIQFERTQSAADKRSRRCKSCTAQDNRAYRERCAATKVCTVDGCGGWALARGLCNLHYHRLNKHGDPLGGAGPKAPNGSGFMTQDGYRAFTVDGRIKREHIAVAERALGKPLPAAAVVHHVDEDKLNNAPSNLVICPDQSYHKLIHTRMRAHEMCGHYDWLACIHCKQFDAPENLRIYHRRGRTLAFHPACNQEHQRRRRAEKRS